MRQRDDEDQKEKLQNLLDNDKNLRSYGLQAEVNEGQAQITGIVDTLAEKQHAEKLARSLPGIRSVDAAIAVSTDGPITDADVTKEVREELKGDPIVDLRHIGVQTAGGKVILKGRASESEVEAARRTAGKARGVTKVLSQVKTKPREMTLEDIFHGQVRNDDDRKKLH